MSKVTKTYLILNHLKTFGRISSMEAFERYKATRLSAVIFNLRKKHIIDTEMVPFDGGRYALYHYRREWDFDALHEPEERELFDMCNGESE